MQAGWMQEKPVWQHSDGCCLPLSLGVERLQGGVASVVGPLERQLLCETAGLALLDTLIVKE